MNLAALWKNYERSGARRLLIARVLESRSYLDGFREAVPGAESSSCVCARRPRRSGGGCVIADRVAWDGPGCGRSGAKSPAS